MDTQGYRYRLIRDISDERLMIANGLGYLPGVGAEEEDGLIFHDLFTLGIGTSEITIASP